MNDRTNYTLQISRVVAVMALANEMDDQETYALAKQAFVHLLQGHLDCGPEFAAKVSQEFSNMWDGTWDEGEVTGMIQDCFTEAKDAVLSRAMRD